MRSVYLELLLQVQIPRKVLKGIPANNSTAEDIFPDILAGAISAMNIAVKIPYCCTPITIDPAVANNEAAIIEQPPNKSADGTHSLPVKNAPKEYPSAKNGFNPM